MKKLVLLCAAAVIAAGAWAQQPSSYYDNSADGSPSEQTARKEAREAKKAAKVEAKAAKKAANGEAVNFSAKNQIEETKTALDSQTQCERDAAEVISLRQQLEWERKSRRMRGYTNLSWVATQKLSYKGKGGEIAKSKMGFGFARGRTFLMHRRPVAEMLWFGLDATWIDINYAIYDKYKMLVNGKSTEFRNDLHHVDLGMGFGPSVHLFPVSKLGVHAYFRYNPTFTTTFDEDFNLMGGYGSFYVSGGAVSWGVISLGAEARWGSGRYDDLSGDAKQNMVDNLLGQNVPGGSVSLDAGSKEAERRKLTSFRTYISFRF